MSSTRLQRMGKLLKEELSRIIREEINDPRLGFVSITDVEMTPDLHVAHIYVSVYGSPEEQEMSVGVLERANRFLRGELGKQVEMRYTPELHFHLDLSIERGVKMYTMLKDLEAKEKEQGDQPS